MFSIASLIIAHERESQREAHERERERGGRGAAWFLSQQKHVADILIGLISEDETKIICTSPFFGLLFRKKKKKAC